VPALAQVTDLTREGIIATSLLVIALVGAGAVIVMLAHGQSLPLAVATPFVGGAVGGMGAGRILVRRLGGQRLETGFGMLLLLVGLLIVTLK
jgi:uncharacterized membrane protein YfcA